MAKGRRGRPKQAQAKRRATTRAGRAPAIDRGTDEIRRLRQLLNGRPDLPTDPLAALYSRELIDEDAYHAGRFYAALVAIARGGWNLREGSVAYLYRRVIAGILGEDAAPIPVSANGHDTTAADHARERLEQMRAALLEADRSGAVLQVVTSICIDGRWEGWLKRFLAVGTGHGGGSIPGDYRALGDLREGLFRLSEVTTSRRREVSPEREAAE